MFLNLGPNGLEHNKREEKKQKQIIDNSGRGGEGSNDKKKYTPRISPSGTWCREWLTCPQSALPLVRQNVCQVQSVAIFFRPARVLEVQSGSAADCRPLESGVMKTTSELGTRRGAGDPVDRASNGRAGTTSKKAWRPGGGAHVSWDLKVLLLSSFLLVSTTGRGCREWHRFDANGLDNQPLLYGWSQHSLEGRATSQGWSQWFARSSLFRT